MTAAAVEVDTSALEELEFPVPCGHSQHLNPMNRHAHEGNAEYIVRAVHMCPGETEMEDYPACAKWANYVIAHYGKGWHCAACGWCGLGEDMCVVLGPLKGG